MRDTIIELYEKLQKDIEFDPIWIKKTKVKMFADEIVELCNLQNVSVPKGTVCRHCKAENVNLIDGLCYGCNCLKV